MKHKRILDTRMLFLTPYQLIFCFLIMGVMDPSDASFNSKSKSFIRHFFSSSKIEVAHQVSVQGFYPLKDIKAFIKQNKDTASTELLHSIQYTFYPTAYLPPSIFRYVGRLGIQLQSSWLVRSHFLSTP